MHTLFLSTNKLKKLQIVQQLLVNKYIGIYSLSEEVQLSLSLTKRYISEINTDVHCLTNHELIVKNKDNVYTLQSLYHQERQNIYTDLQLLYLNDSLSFQLCKTVCGSTKIKLSEICTLLSVSRAHAFRIIKELNAVLQQFNVRFELNKNGYYIFMGEEISIRIFIFNFVNQCIDFDEWIFPTTSQLEIQATLLRIINLPYPKYSKRQIILFAAVFQTRIKTRNYLSKLTDKYIFSLLEKFQYFSELSVHDYLLKQNATDDNVIQTEILYLSFFARILLADSLPKDNVLLIGEKFLNDTRSNYKLLNNLGLSWSQKSMLNFSYQQNCIFMYYCTIFYTLTLLDITLLDIWFLDLPENKKNAFLDTELQTRTINFFKSFIQKNATTDMYSFWLSSTSMTNFCSLLYLTTIQSYSKQLTIYLYFTKSFNTKDFIYSFLKNNFNASLIKFVDSPNEASLIITDRFDYPKSSDQRIVVISDFFNKTQLHMLLQMINEYILN